MSIDTAGAKRGVYLARKAAVRALQATRLNGLASRLYYKLNGFQPAGPGLDEGFEAIFAKVAELGSLKNSTYCEFGVFKGYSFWKAQQLVARYRIEGVSFLGFDSFQGLPEVTGVDRTDHGEFRKGQYSCSLRGVKRNLDRAGGVDWTRAALVEGFFEDTLTPELIAKHGVKHVGVAMIDCDLYSSTVTVLDWLRPMIRAEMVLIMDDWNCFGADDSKGQRRAMREFLASEPRWRLEPIAAYGLNSQAFVVRDRATMRAAASPAASALHGVGALVLALPL